MHKLGLIGLGGMGQGHARRLKALENVEIVGCCDLIEEKRNKVAGEVGAEAFADFRELLPMVDAVWVCTEPFNRREIVLAAAGAGKHIFTEKPVANRIDHAEEIVRAAEGAGVKYMLGYCLRFWQPYKLLKSVFASGELGDLVECWTRRYMPMVPPGWYGEQEKSGGIALDFGSHDVDLLCWIGGRPKTVFGHVARTGDGYTADDHAGGVLLFETGGVGKTSVSWSSALPDTSLGVIGTKGAIIAERDGTVRKKLAGGEVEIIDTKEKMGIDPSGRRMRTGDGGEAHVGLDKGLDKTFDEGLHEHFFRCIEEDERPRVTGRDGLEVLRAVEALKESARTGRAVEIPKRP